MQLLQVLEQRLVTHQQEGLGQVAQHLVLVPVIHQHHRQLDLVQVQVIHLLRPLEDLVLVPALAMQDLEDRAQVMQLLLHLTHRQQQHLKAMAASHQQYLHLIQDPEVLLDSRLILLLDPVHHHKQVPAVIRHNLRQILHLLALAPVLAEAILQLVLLRRNLPMLLQNPPQQPAFIILLAIRTILYHIHRQAHRVVYQQDMNQLHRQNLIQQTFCKMTRCLCPYQCHRQLISYPI